ALFAGIAVGIDLAHHHAARGGIAQAELARDRRGQRVDDGAEAVADRLLIARRLRAAGLAAGAVIPGLVATGVDAAQPRQLVLARPLVDRDRRRAMLAVADDLDRRARADRLLGDQIAERLVLGDAAAGNGDDDVALADAGALGRAAGRHRLH